MAKLTLSDITSGYQTLAIYNANNALIEAAIENTLSRDGTSPNQMEASIDMNSNHVQNIAQLTATSFILNGQVITPASVLATALDAPDVSYTPTNPAGPLTTLQDALDDDYMRNDRNESLTGTFTASGLITAQASLAVTGNITVTGLVDGIDIAARDATARRHVAEQSGHTRAGPLQYVKTGQGGLSSVLNFKPQAISTFESWGPTGSGADNIIPDIDEAITAGAKMLLFKVRMSATQDHASNGVQLILFAAEGDATPSVANSLDYAAYLSLDTNAVGESATIYVDIMVPVTSAGIFQMAWFETFANVPIIEGIYKGFITD